MVTVQSFRLQFPAFWDPERFSDPLVAQWLVVAKQFVDPGRWGALLDFGVNNVLAHFLTLVARDVATAAVGGVPGESTGPISSKSVDKVSLGYAVQLVAEKDAGHWNLTTYGQIYYRQAQIMGMGPVTIAPCGPGDMGTSIFATAWFGPFPF